MKDAMLEALEEIENGMCRIKERRSIWQNSLIYALCQAVRLLLIDKIKQVQITDYCSYGERKEV